MNGNDIIKNALKFKDYVYWYGGKRQKCTKKLLNTLSKLYPKIYTKKYIEKCEIDIKNNKYTIDCSGLVCGAYKIPDIGSSQIANTFKVWNGYPKNGMVCWRNGHVGIFVDGKTFEASGIDSDVRYVPFNMDKWSKILYLEDIDYGESEKPLPAPKKIHPNKILLVVNTKKDPLTLRSGYGTKYNSIINMPKGTKVSWYGYVDKSEKWYYVNAVVNGKIYCGWAYSEYLK